MYSTIWYHSLIKPSFVPPEWAFYFVWSLIYISMAVAFVVVFSNFDFREKRLALSFFLIQLLLNFSWSPVFFYFHNVFAALIISALLFLFVFLTTIQFFKYSKLAGWLFIPYLSWVAFAFFINYKILVLN